MRVRRFMVLAVVALVALAGCSKSGGTTPTAATSGNAGTTGAGGGGSGAAPDPCSLLTTDEASAILGQTAANGAPHSSTGTKQCEWDASAGSIAILIWIGGWRARWQDNHDTAKTAFPTKFADVSGLGDAAYSNGIDLHILKGDDMYQIGVLGTSDAVAAATTVAQKALARA